MCSSHEELPAWLIEFEARGSVSMDREERLRRRREQARLKRAAETPEQREARSETPEQREARLARRRQYERRLYCPVKIGLVMRHYTLITAI